jgi:hypothetical protein
MCEINIQNAQRKLRKYRDLLTSPVYPVASVLVPWIKWTYLESASSTEELEVHKAAVQAFWDDSYAGIVIGEPVIEEEAPTGADPPLVSALFT